MFQYLGEFYIMGKSRIVGIVNNESMDTSVYVHNFKIVSLDMMWPTY